ALEEYLETGNTAQRSSNVYKSLEGTSSTLHCPPSPPILGGKQTNASNSPPKVGGPGGPAQNLSNSSESPLYTADSSSIQQTTPDLIFFFPSEQEQNLTWGKELYETYPAFQAIIDQANQILSELKADLIDFNPTPDPDILNFVLPYALAELWQSWGIRPSGMMGSRAIATCQAGYFTLEQALHWLVKAAPIEQLQQPTGILYSDSTDTPVDTATLLDWLRSGDQQTISPPQGPEQFLIMGNLSQSWGTCDHWTIAAQPDNLLKSLGKLYQQGFTVDWDSFYRGFKRQRIPLPTYPFQRQRYWSDLATSGAKISPAPSVNVTGTRLSRESLASLSPEQRQAELEQDLRTRFADAIGVDPKQITATTPLSSLAADSIMTTEIKFDLEKQLGYSVPLVQFLTSPTIANLAAQILANLDGRIETLPDLELNPTQRHQPFPLNDIQTAYWIGRSGTFEMGNVAAHVYAEFEGQGLDCHRLQRAFQKVINRHPVLRTVILPDGQQQVLADLPPYEMSVLDWRSRSSDLKQQQLEHLRDRLSHQMLDPHTWPLFEVCIARLDEQTVHIFLSIDNLLVDGASLRIICREWGYFYTALDNDLPTLELSFRDYVLALQSFEQSERYLQSKNYWQARLPELPPAPELPLAVAPAQITRPQFVRRTARLSADQWQLLKEQATQLGLTPSGALLAAYTEVLATWSKSRRFCVNLTTFNRLPIHPQVQSLVGDFTSLTLLAVDYREVASFEVRSQQLQNQLWKDLEHSLVSGVSVLREMVAQTQEQVAMPVVFTSLLANPQLQNRSTFNTDWLGTLVHSIAQTPQVWLDHQVYEDNGELVYNWDVVEGLFPEGMVDAMFSAYGQLLEKLALHPQTWQKTQPLPITHVQSQSTQAPLTTALLQDGLVSQAQHQPQHLAVITPTLQLTYGELCQRAQQVGQRLRRLGVQANELVAISMEKGWEQIVAVYGILMAGAAYVPIDPTLPMERRDHLLDQGNIKWVLSQNHLQSGMAWPIQVQIIAVDSEELQQEYDAPLTPLQKPTDLAYVIYTSGSTGTPKGVMIDHQGAMNTIEDINHRFEITPQDRILALSSLSFDLSVYDIFGTIGAGGTLVMPAARDAKDAAVWVRLIQKHQVTIWNTVPALMQMLITREPEALESLRLILMSGDWIPLALPEKIRAVCPESQIISLGGATEASIWSILYPINEIDPSWRSIPYGRAMRNQQFYVLNEHLNPCPVWVPGHLYIGGSGLAQGYWGEPEKTAASFIAHPISGECLYRTGDLGCYRLDGEIEFLGREDQQVKLRGYRIELGEIETALEQHPDVSAAVALVIGSSPQKLVACIVKESPSSQESEGQKETGDPNSGERTSVLTQFLAQKLPDYMVPEGFLWLDAFPLNANGKVDRRQLQTLWVENPLTSSVGYIAPRNALETAVADLWAELLQQDKVGISDNFFALGGDSLLATQLMARVRQMFRVEVPLRSLFQAPTVATIATAIAEGLAAQVNGELLAELADIAEPETIAPGVNHE
ncbi:MAG: amino acid adenylation domain-containing protein, partial [Cyanobacteria bacterium P01_A01_bin.17]